MPIVVHQHPLEAHAGGQLAMLPVGTVIVDAVTVGRASSPSSPPIPESRFKYVALDKRTGQTVQDTVVAESSSAARDQLVDLGFENVRVDKHPIDVAPTPQSESSKDPYLALVCVTDADADSAKVPVPVAILDAEDPLPGTTEGTGWAYVGAFGIAQPRYVFVETGLGCTVDRR